MKIDARWSFPHSVEQFWTCFDDPEWHKEEETAVDQRATVLETRWEGDVEVRRSRFESGMKLPSLVASRLGSDTLTYELVNRLDRKASRLVWEVVPPAMRDKIVARGEMRVVATPTGCEQTLTGDVTVSIPLVGGQIEKGVVDGILTSHHKTADRRRAWMKKRFG